MYHSVSPTGSGSSSLPPAPKCPPALLVFEVHGGCTGDTAREIRHLLNAWSEQNGYDETRCAVNRHAWRYYIACMLAHAVQAQVRWLAEPVAASG